MIPTQAIPQRGPQKSSLPGKGNHFYPGWKKLSSSSLEQQGVCQLSRVERPWYEIQNKCKLIEPGTQPLGHQNYWPRRQQWPQLQQWLGRFRHPCEVALTDFHRGSGDSPLITIMTMRTKILKPHRGRSLIWFHYVPTQISP